MAEAVPFITAIAGVLSGVKSLTGGGGGGGGGAPAAPPPPTDKTSFTSPSPTQPPAFAQLSQQMTPTQQLSKIATMGTSGGPEYRDPAVQEYFSNLAQRTYVDPTTGSVRQGMQTNPVYEQYVKDVMGKDVLKPGDPASFLSALLRQ